jgi:hypothetical protein
VIGVTGKRLFSGFCQVTADFAQGWHVCCNYFSEDPVERSRESTATHTPKTQAHNPMIEQQPRKQEEEKQKQ